MPLNQHLFSFDPVQCYRDDRICYGSVRAAVVFAHTNEPTPYRIEGGISIPAQGALTNRLGNAVLILTIKLLIGVISEKDDSPVDKDSATTVLVHP